MSIEKGNIIVRRVSRNENFQSAVSRIIADLQDSDYSKKREKAIQLLREAEKALED